jgi:hydroxyacylglutathione hydrolase
VKSPEPTNTSNTMTDSAMLLRTFPVGPFQCNCCIIGDPQSKAGIVIDPGGEPQRILEEIQVMGLQIIRIIHTHAHLDHLLASGVLHEQTGAPLQVHKADRFLWDGFQQQCRMAGIDSQPLPLPQHWLSDDEALDCCGGVALHTPGHTPGSMSFWFGEHHLLVAGDTLFNRGIGRTDLPGGSYKEIENSIIERLFRLDEDTRVITGHGPETSIGYEMKLNPFFGEVMR